VEALVVSSGLVPAAAAAVRDGPLAEAVLVAGCCAAGLDGGVGDLRWANAFKGPTHTQTITAMIVDIFIKTSIDADTSAHSP
jgi:hypothetical protein